MCIKILTILSIYTYLKTKNVDADFNSSYSIFIESIFQSKCEILNKLNFESYCKINLVGDTLEFNCQYRQDWKMVTKSECRIPYLKGTFNLDQEAKAMFSCLTKFQIDEHHNRTRNCNMSHEYYQRHIFKKCSRRNVTEIEIYANRYTNSKFYEFLTSKLTELRQIKWLQFDECWPLNKFLRNFNFLHKFIINYAYANDLNKCSDYSFTNLTQITELRIEIDTYYSEEISLLHENLLRGMDNLEVFELIFSFNLNDGEIEIVNELFKGLTKLSTLKFVNCNINLLTEEHFKDLVNLKSLTIQGGLIMNINWLSFQIIQNQLMFLELDEGVLHHKSNITSFTCTNSSYCDFNVDVHKKPCPVGCTCYLHRSTLQFKIDCDHIQIGKRIPEIPIPITGNASLYFNNRILTELPNSTLYGYSNITGLHLANNKLKSLTVDQLPENLTYLDLRNNSLQNLDYKVLEYLSKRAGTISINLSGNPWSCNCDLFKLLDNGSFIIGDRDQIRIKCQNQYYGLWILLLNVGFCKPYFHIISGFLLGFAVITLTLFCFKNLIMMWLYERNLCLSCVSRPETRDESVLKIDAFLAFSHIDLQLVEEFVEKLEQGSRKYQLCFYQRDWLIGESIPACILNSIEDSKRIIILMTNNFINSSWGLFEFRTAIKATSMNKEKRLIVILYPGVDIDELDSELKVYMKYNTYLRRDDPLFWRKLIFAMPHKQINCEHSFPTDPRAIGDDQL